MKNMIGMEVKKLDTLHDLLKLAAGLPAREILTLSDHPKTEGLVVYQCLQLDSSRAGETDVVAVGPQRTYSLEAAIAGRLGDVPSRFKYPIAYWEKPKKEGA